MTLRRSCLVSGHDFSRAEQSAATRALAPGECKAAPHQASGQKESRQPKNPHPIPYRRAFPVDTRRDDNIRDHTSDPKGVKKDELGILTATGVAGTIANTGFVFTNVKWSINGYIYGNTPMMTIKKGEHVRWYVATLGDFNNPHAARARQYRARCRAAHDVLVVTSAHMITADMVPDAAGIWLFG